MMMIRDRYLVPFFLAFSGTRYLSPCPPVPLSPCVIPNIITFLREYYLSELYYENYSKERENMKGMNGNAELLNFVYQNSQMGVDTIRQLISIAEEDVFSEHLEEQQREYEAIHSEAREKLNQNGFDEKGISAFEKVRTYLMINMQTLTDKSSSHISEMLMVGSNMGIIDAIKNIKKYSDAEPDIIALMERLLRFEENNVQRLKEFL